MWTLELRRVLVKLVCLCVLLSCVSTAPLRLFYPYGENNGDESLLKTDDASSAEIQLQAPIHFYDGFYTSIFVNSNGHLSFESEFPAYLPTLVLPLDSKLKVIAAFLSDVDLTRAGDVFYRETWDEALLQRAALDIQGHFSQFSDFEPLGLFVATWDRVPAYGGDTNVVNTFQVVIASDELNSFVIFNYLDNGLQWTRSVGKMASARLSDPPGQAGFDSGTGRLHTKLPYAGTEEAAELARESNVNQPGVWMFRVGNTRGDNVVGPDLNTGDVEIYNPVVDQPNCQQGGSQACHKDGVCVDYEDGYCCTCVPPLFGNGKSCISKESPQRVNGKVSGNINGVSFEKLDLHTFVMTKEGRSYTAVSRVPEQISSHMMTLNTIGGIIGWIFALPNAAGALNGYSFTGGVFRRTAIISYQKGGEILIDQQFFGPDASNNIQMSTNITGTIPDIGAAEKITVDDYVEEYRRINRGQIHSRSSRTYRVNNIASQYTWDQNITFSDCTANPDPVMDTMRHSVTKNFIVYDNGDHVVRYAMSNAVTVIKGKDPCRENNCADSALCVPQDDSYFCMCRTGFVGDGTYCQDLDECAIDLDTCNENARCVNVPGSFQCFCEHGYVGDGIDCRREIMLCGSDQCSENARCVMNDVENRPMCECNSGYSGDGVTCNPIAFTCNEADICHENADCIYSPIERSYVCVCVEGYSGDGVMCEPYDAVGQCARCDPNAECVYDIYRLIWRCVCKPGFTGDERSCAPIEGDAIECESCDPNASCFVDDQDQRYRCECNSGFIGTGYQCDPDDCRREPAQCDVNAQCTQDVSGGYSCICRPGFSGDGRSCQPAGCEELNNCDLNAQCVPDPRDTSRHICRCKAGYSGDGYVCIRRVIPCNEVNNCSPYAVCVPDPLTRSFACRCKRGYEGDGITCTVRGVDCHRNPALCDPNASCLLNVDTFVCVCNQNYRGDGSYCSAMRDEQQYLLFSRGYSIHKVPYTQNGIDKDGTRVLYVPGDLAIGVASDCEDQTFYWTDAMNGRVCRADIDGTNKEPVANGFQSPEGVAIDWLSRNMYVTDSGLDIVAVVNLNGTNKKTLISDGIINPRAIIVDPQRGVMYWTDWFRDKPTIEVANMDGSDRRVFVETDLGLPNGLTIDYHTQTICWGDAGVNRIECIRSDGIGRRIVTEDAPYPFDLTFTGNTIYWSDWTIRGVPSVDRNGGETAEPLSLPVGGNGRMYGITTVGEHCPRVVNACYRSNGGCSFLCLPTPFGGRTCACPDDIDEETCAEIAFVNKRK